MRNLEDYVIHNLFGAQPAFYRNKARYWYKHDRKRGVPRQEARVHTAVYIVAAKGWTFREEWPNAH